MEYERADLALAGEDISMRGHLSGIYRLFSQLIQTHRNIFLVHSDEWPVNVAEEELGNGLPSNCLLDL